LYELERALAHRLRRRFENHYIVVGVHRSDPSTPGRVPWGCSFGEQLSAGRKSTSGEKKELGGDERVKQQQQQQ
jgi:hypothetical protein